MSLTQRLFDEVGFEIDIKTLTMDPEKHCFAITGLVLPFSGSDMSNFASHFIN
jgi:hypothetical protein